MNTNEWREATPFPPPPELGQTGTYLDRGHTLNSCNLLITNSLNQWRRGESNHQARLKTRKLLKIRDAQAARNAGRAVRMYTACTRSSQKSEYRQTGRIVFSPRVLVCRYFAADRRAAAR